MTASSKEQREAACRKTQHTLENRYKVIATAQLLERVMGIEPTQPAWKAGILPLNYTRLSSDEWYYNML